MLSHLMCDYPIRARLPIKTSFTLFENKAEAGGMYECSEMRPSCFETFAYPLTWNYFVEPSSLVFHHTSVTRPGHSTRAMSASYCPAQ